MIATNAVLEEEVKKQLKAVYDPEIKTVNIVDLGMVDNISITNNKAIIDLLPTFLGCPALGIIKDNVVDAIKKINVLEEVEVNYIKFPPWTSERISEKGREDLKQFGIAPPPLKLEKGSTWEVECPFCGSKHNTMENIFGPSACRSILYCKSCKNPFEAMKPISSL